LFIIELNKKQLTKFFQFTITAATCTLEWLSRYQSKLIQLIDSKSMLQLSWV